MSFPGKCDRCDGPQEWTIYAGVTFVRCERGCQGEQLTMEGFDLPSDSEDPGYSFARSVEGLEPLPGRGVEAYEGDATDEVSEEAVRVEVHQVRQDLPLFHGGDAWLVDEV